MVVVIVSGNREGEHVQIPDGKLHLGEVMGLPINVEVFVTDGRSFIRGEFSLPDGCSPGSWFEVEEKTLIVAKDFLLLCEPKS